jgi:hypothetical protein
VHEEAARVAAAAGDQVAAERHLHGAREDRAHAAEIERDTAS